MEMLNSSPLAIISYDPEGVVTFWNPAAEKTFGWSAEEAVGKRLPIVPADEQGEFEMLLLRALEGEASMETELRRRSADGSPIVVRSSTAPLRGPDGTICGIMEILSDVTDRKAEEESRAHLLMALEQAGNGVIVTDARGVIVYVNTAFERVSGFRREEVLGQKPKVLKSGKLDGEFYRKLWEAIGRGDTWRGTLVNRKKDGTLFEEDAVISPVRDSSGRIVSYVGLQRDIAPWRELEGGAPRDARRIAAGGGRRLFLPRTLDLNRVLSGMDRMLRRLAGEQLRISLAPGRNIGRVLATQGKVEQLIAGLVVHARGIMPLGGRIAIKTCDVELPSSGSPLHPDVPPGSYVLLSLDGTGAGMEPGDGIGPAAAGEIVRQFEGHFRIERLEGGGVVFHGYLPRVEPSAAERLAGDSCSPGSLAHGTGTILLVEDEDVVRLPAAEILRSCGYDVIEARQGREALLLSEAHRGKIDLLLTDVMMPKMDGQELASRLRELRPDTRILLMSGYAGSNGGRIESPEKGFAFLGKPFTAEALSFKVQEVLDVP
jgi:two-component system cell cycle sensor histidine kinase/response regulator CckA